MRESPSPYYSEPPFSVAHLVYGGCTWCVRVLLRGVEAQERMTMLRAAADRVKRAHFVSLDAMPAVSSCAVNPKPLTLDCKP